MNVLSSHTPLAVSERLEHYPLLDALIERRSRRFAPGMRLNGGLLAYASARQPEPLTLEEEAALAFTACGVRRVIGAASAEKVVRRKERASRVGQ